MCYTHSISYKGCEQICINTKRDSLVFYKSLGYDGVFITNHFLDGNINIDSSVPYRERIEFYFSDYEEGVKIGKEIGLKVFLGVESSYKGTDFLIYGLDKAWYLAHPEIMEMKRSALLSLLRESGALVIQAHPFRQAGYIDHVRLFPDRVDGFEVINGNRTDFIKARRLGQSRRCGANPSCRHGV